MKLFSSVSNYTQEAGKIQEAAPELSFRAAYFLIPSPQMPSRAKSIQKSG